MDDVFDDDDVFCDNNDFLYHILHHLYHTYDRNNIVFDNIDIAILIMFFL